MKSLGGTNADGGSGRQLVDEELSVGHPFETVADHSFCKSGREVSGGIKRREHLARSAEARMPDTTAKWRRVISRRDDPDVVREFEAQNLTRQKRRFDLHDQAKSRLARTRTRSRLSALRRMIGAGSSVAA